MRSTLIPACSLGGSALPAGRVSSLRSASTVSRETAVRNWVTRIQATRDDPSPALAAHPADAAIPPAGKECSSSLRNGRAVRAVVGGTRRFGSA